MGSFVLSFVWRYFLKRKEMGRKAEEEEDREVERRSLIRDRLFANPKARIGAMALLGVFILAFPFLFSMYRTNIMITALMYVMLGLGLNIVVGLGGLLNLGYIAFYAVGAYSYALLNLHFGVSFWLAIPIGAAMSALFGILLGIPVLRLRGDYLAIVTLAFGEIIRIVLENWNDFSRGPSGIANIPRPDLFGVQLSLRPVTVFLYFLMVILTMITIFFVRRLEDSRLGRAWIAMREDEIACQAMGIDTVKAKITAFALGAIWAGLAGVLFAAKTTFINPASFTVWESIIVLCIIVLGGMGSIPGIVVGAFILILLPEYLRVFSEYRMLLFGVVMVVMMVFKPEGIIPARRKLYTFKPDPDPEHKYNLTAGEK